MNRDALQTALTRTTETLAQELACPSDHAPHWSPEEWLIARAAASMHGVSPLLAGALRWHGPAGWTRFLADQRAQTAARHARVLELLGRIDACMRSHGVPVLAMKGAALHAMGLYGTGDRPMADVDLLTHPRDFERSSQLLTTLGFELTAIHSRHNTFEQVTHLTPAPFGEHAANGLKIELHQRVQEALPVRVVDLSAQILANVLDPGLNAYPSKAVLLAHIVLHASGSLCMRALRLLHLQDVTRLAARMRDADWREFLRAGNGREGALWWAYPLLMMASRYGASVPAWVLHDPSLNCSWRLRRSSARCTLSAVSLSTLKIVAFPGIGWTGSVGEMLICMKRRIKPDAELLRARRYVVNTQPAHAGVRWSHASQTYRVLLWLTSRPSRSETMFAVRMALAQEP